MIEVTLKNIEKYYGGNRILEDISFEIQRGERVGVLGRNGSGKTTIFKIISKLENYDGGVLSIGKGLSIGYLDQIPEYSQNHRVIDVLNEAFKNVLGIKERLRALESEMASLEGEKLNRVMKNYGELQIKYESIGGYEIEEKISRICTGLKINEKFKERFFYTLSGGEKTTVMLGKILLQNPDILLLDEPTNHLDIDSTQWLEEFLREYEGTALIISHDRYFLDTVINKIVEIEDGKASIYHGNYSYYTQEKERRLIQQFESYRSQQKKIKAMDEALKRFKDWGNRAGNPAMFKKAANMQKRIDRMEKIERPTLEKPNMRLDFSKGSRAGKDVIKVNNLRKSFKDKIIFKNLSLHVRYGEKIGILGKNGCGKSTLIKILLNEIKADAGEVNIGAGAKAGYLEQEIEFIDKEHTILEAFREEHLVSERQARSILAGFLFYADDVFKKVKNLSGGEKVRLKLCQLMHRDINLLILDEPTNHLDIDSREMLEEALDRFDGTIVFISHDRYFINKIADKILEIDNKNLTSYVGNYDYYRQKKSEKKLVITQKPNIKREKPLNKNKKIDDSKKKEKRIKELEEEIERLEGEIEKLDSELTNPSHDHKKLAEIHKEKCDLQIRLDILMEDWIKLSL